MVSLVFAVIWGACVILSAALVGFYIAWFIVGPFLERRGWL